MSAPEIDVSTRPQVTPGRLDFTAPPKAPEGHAFRDVLHRQQRAPESRPDVASRTAPEAREHGMQHRMERTESRHGETRRADTPVREDVTETRVNARDTHATGDASHDAGDTDSECEAHHDKGGEAHADHSTDQGDAHSDSDASDDDAIAADAVVVAPGVNPGTVTAEAARTPARNSIGEGTPGAADTTARAAVATAPVAAQPALAEDGATSVGTTAQGDSKAPAALPPAFARAVDVATRNTAAGGGTAPANANAATPATSAKPGLSGPPVASPPPVDPAATPATPAVPATSSTSVAAATPAPPEAAGVGTATVAKPSGTPAAAQPAVAAATTPTSTESAGQAAEIDSELEKPAQAASGAGPDDAEAEAEAETHSQRSPRSREATANTASREGASAKPQDSAPSLPQQAENGIQKAAANPQAAQATARFNVAQSTPDGEGEVAARGTGGTERAAPSQGATMTTGQALQQADAVREAKGAAQARRAEMFDQVMDRTLHMVRGGDREATLRLTPEHLGELKIRVVMERGGVMAEMVAQTQAARDLLESNQSRLQQALLDNGAESAQVDVSLGREQTAKGSGDDSNTSSRQTRSDTPGEAQAQTGSTMARPAAAEGGVSIVA
ncbi:MAG: flagellar hook-length control protein FliK [Leptospirillia bacterium]